MLRLAEQLLRRGEAEDALATLTRGLENRPGHVAALVLRGRCLLALERLDEAGAELESVLAVDPTQLVAAKLLAQVWLRASAVERAGVAVSRYAHLQPLDPDLAAFQRQLTALRRDAPPSSEEDLGDGRAGEQGSSNEPGSASGVGLKTVTLAELYLQQGHARDAAAMLLEILDSDPANAAAQEALMRARGARPYAG